MPPDETAEAGKQAVNPSALEPSGSATPPKLMFSQPSPFHAHRDFVQCEARFGVLEVVLQ